MREEVISRKLWERVGFYVFEQIYLPAAQTSDSGTFNTQVDIRLKQWADLTLPHKSVDVGFQTLQEEFNRLIDKNRSDKCHDNIFDFLKISVAEESIKRHTWESKAAEVLAQLNELIGPGFVDRWVKWKSKSDHQNVNSYIKYELDKLLAQHNTQLSCDDIVLFWRIQRMIAITANALRQQVMNTEGRRLEKEIKEVLDDYSQDSEKKISLLTGRRVQLAEELKRVRQIQEKLEEFIALLNEEK
ncbi:unnamed protein product [Oppiella nova]|uniref:Dynamin-like GTPase OPA1 C-terminal domain-containing protein n=1 Tax=Oppiella nova TaxID=334625 RepID=A0A7R9LY29_9ACAR|nr:unnamed protein product [Oppiella nova]CAG2168030.1 unnamed protein product [Oppiella nova]